MTGARPGTVLVAVLVVTSLAAVVTLGTLYLVQAEAAGAAAVTRGEQAYHAAMAGLDAAAALLRTSRDVMGFWRDNPELFQNQLVATDGAEEWRFIVYAPNPLEPDTVRYGLVDEASKLNLYTADEAMLAGWASMPPELLDAYLDWTDSDDDTRTDGAEQDYYDRLPVPYRVRNRRVRSVEELLLVKGFSGRVVYGEDANQNGLLDPNEDDGDDTFPPDDRDGTLNVGLKGLATIYSYDLNLDAFGEPRLDLNGDPNLMRELGLSEGTATFIAVYRAEGNRFTSPADLVSMEYQLRQDHEVTLSDGSRQQLRRGTTLQQEATPEDVAILCDRLTTAPANRPVVGLVNLNTAPAEVLAALPGVGEALAREIVDVRAGLAPEESATIAWLYTMGVVDAATFRQVAPRLTTHSYQFTVRVIGYGAVSRQYCVLEAVLDAAETPARILYLRDLTRLGAPFALDPDSLEYTD